MHLIYSCIHFFLINELIEMLSSLFFIKYGEVPPSLGQVDWTFIHEFVPLFIYLFIFFTNIKLHVFKLNFHPIWTFPCASEHIERFKYKSLMDKIMFFFFDRYILKIETTKIISQIHHTSIFVETLLVQAGYALIQWKHQSKVIFSVSYLMESKIAVDK